MFLGSKYSVKKQLFKCGQLLCNWRPKGEKTVVHFGLHLPGNAGDTLLFPAVRRLVDTTVGPVRWDLRLLRDKVDEKLIRHINATSKGIIIGGGGVFLGDTNKNINSGWQWNCSMDLLKEIRVPIIIFAVGYNRFRGQEEFSPVFKESISEMAKKSAFFGLRNHGSIRAIKTYLDKEGQDKLKFQPCPTTVLDYIYPELIRPATNKNRKRLALNIAFDREELRFGDKKKEVIASLVSSMKWADDNGWDITVLLHYKPDGQIVRPLKDSGVDFRVIDLEGRPAKEVIKFYSDMPLTIGMRGHSQMIPFGVGNKIISLISHDKMKWFLEDIEHPEWGIEILDAGLADLIKEALTYSEEKDDSIVRQVKNVKSTLWDITFSNMKIIKRIFDATVK